MDHETCLNLFRYVNGKLFWEVSRGSISKGKLAGTLHHSGYLQVRYKRKGYLLHRLIWFYHYGEWPLYLDHINGDKQDNRIENLRVCSVSQNNANRKSKGVYKRGNRFVSSIRCNKQYYYLGSFSTSTEAKKAYEKASIEKFGQFARTNGE